MMQGKKYSVVYTEIWYQFLIGNVRPATVETEDVTLASDVYQFLIGNVRLPLPEEAEENDKLDEAVSIPHR